MLIGEFQGLKEKDNMSYVILYNLKILCDANCTLMTMNLLFLVLSNSLFTQSFSNGRRR